MITLKVLNHPLGETLYTAMGINNASPSIITLRRDDETKMISLSTLANGRQIDLKITPGKIQEIAVDLKGQLAITTTVERVKLQHIKFFGVTLVTRDEHDVVTRGIQPWSTRGDFQGPVTPVPVVHKRAVADALNSRAENATAALETLKL